MVGTVLSGLHLLAHSSQQPYEVDTIINSILQMRKLREREVNRPAQEYRNKMKSWISNPEAWLWACPFNRYILKHLCYIASIDVCMHWPSISLQSPLY